jgi:hypothetical protein
MGKPGKRILQIVATLAVVGGVSLGLLWRKGDKPLFTAVISRDAPIYRQIEQCHQAAPGGELSPADEVLPAGTTIPVLQIIAGKHWPCFMIGYHGDHFFITSDYFRPLDSEK